MAYMNQEKKAKIAAQLKRVVPKSWKYSLAVRNHSTICMTITQAPVDLIDAYTMTHCSDEVRSACMRQRSCDVNPYYWHDHFQGSTLSVFKGIFEALNIDNHDRSDPITDYFNVGHYVEVLIGRWDKPFIHTGAELQAAA